MWKVQYTGLQGYGVSRSFGTKADAQDFIDVNAMVYRLPNCRLVFVSDYRKPTLSQLQAVRDRIGEQYIWSSMTETEWAWQSALCNAMIDRVIFNDRPLSAR